MNHLIIAANEGGYLTKEGAYIEKSTITGRLRKELVATGTENELKIGIEVPVYRSLSGKIYLDKRFCYVQECGVGGTEHLIESDHLELKQSLFVTASGDCDKEGGGGPKQFEVLARAIFSFVNAGIKDWSLKIGYYNNGTPKGLDAEVPTIADERSFEVRFKNYIAQTCNKRLFARSLNFNWSKLEGKKVLSISADEWHGGLLLLEGVKLYLRDGASSVLLKWDDLLNYIKSL